MTLIMTCITQRGIINACDSNITLIPLNPTRRASTVEKQKIFKVRNQEAYLTVAGSYTVRGIHMNQWIKHFLDNQVNTPDLSDLANNLKNKLQLEMLQSEKVRSCIIHIAGYVKENDIWHPEFWFVRNATGINEVTGEYLIGNDFVCGEEFWGAYTEHENYNFIHESPGNARFYFNGHVGGRIGINTLLNNLIMGDRSFFHQMWNNPNVEFRPPRNLKEDENLIRLYFNVIGVLYKLSNYPAPYIGGKINLKTSSCPNEN